MQVILRENVENLGRIGDIVKVSDGYARNFLLPGGKARRGGFSSASQNPCLSKTESIPARGLPIRRWAKCPRAMLVHQNGETNVF